MIRIGRHEFGLAPLSMAIVFVVLSIFAVLSAFGQARPEWPMPLSSLLIINEGMALLATLIYGILLHLVTAFISWKRTREELK